MIEILKDTYASLFSKLTLSIWLIASLGTVLAGPFGTFDSMSFGMRALYWPLVTTSSILLGYLAYAITRMMVGKTEDLKSHVIAGALGTLFIATDVFMLSQLVSPDRDVGEPYLHFLGWVGFVFLAVILGRVMFLKAISSEISEQILPTIKIEPHNPLPEAVDGPRILDRLPKTEHGMVMRLSANDHFVHIVTEAGEHPVRMRLRDAISEMDGIAGSLLHRSHWVAHEAITQQDKAEGKVQIVLKNGDRIPVSRNYRSVVDDLNVPAKAHAAAKRSSVSVQ